MIRIVDQYPDFDGKVLGTHLPDGLHYAGVELIAPENLDMWMHIQVAHEEGVFDGWSFYVAFTEKLKGGIQAEVLSYITSQIGDEAILKAISESQKNKFESYAKGNKLFAAPCKFVFYTAADISEPEIVTLNKRLERENNELRSNIAWFTKAVDRKMQANDALNHKVKHLEGENARILGETLMNDYY